MLVGLDDLVLQLIAQSLGVRDCQALMHSHRDFQTVARYMKPIAEKAENRDIAHATRFTYNQYYHATPTTCVENGCAIQHVKLEILASHAPAMGKRLTSVALSRKRCRAAARLGTLMGTVHSHKAEEMATNPNLKDSQRQCWWWHRGDPELVFVHQILGLPTPDEEARAVPAAPR